MSHAPPLRRKNKRLDAYTLLHESFYSAKKDKKAIDLNTIKGLAAIGSTREEISTIIGCSMPWLDKQIANNPAMAMAIELGTAELKTSLRRTQVQMALSGNVPLLIWLGKQCLGQSDKHEQNNKTEINVTVQRATEELRNIPRGQLLAALELMQAPVIDNETKTGEAVNIEGGVPPVAD